MEEWSRILIEDYCRKHKSAKSRRLEKLVRLSYDVSAEGTDADAVFLESAIEKETDSELKKALKDLDDFLFGF